MCSSSSQDPSYELLSLISSTRDLRPTSLTRTDDQTWLEQATPSVADQMPRLAALLTTCSTLAPESCTLCSPLAVVPSSHSQYLAPCDGGGYYYLNYSTKILFELALQLSRLTH
jgi:hypothetical protein